MAYVARFDILTDSSGDWTQTQNIGFGLFHQYRYVPDGTSPLATGADLDIVGAQTGVIYANQDDIGTTAFAKAPRQVTHGVDGVDRLYAASGQEVEDFIALAEPIKVTIANGGSAKKGTLYVWVQG